MQPRQARLEIRLLGPMQVAVEDNQPAHLTADKVRALLAYLAVNPNQPHRREKLAGLLWPESPEASARASLRVALSKLRDAIDDRRTDPERLELSRQSVIFRPGQACHIDSNDFDQALQHLPDVERTVDELAFAVSLYHGSFMEGFTLADCAEFEEWQTVQREHYHTSAVTALGRLADAFERRGQLDEAIALIRRQVALDPWREEGHRRLMDLLAQSGFRSEALAQFRNCRQVLASELGVAPAEETVALYQRIRDDVGLPQPVLTTMRPLPSPLTPLVGRDAETAEIGALLTNPDVRLVTIVGTGGIGKTHLALAVAIQWQERFPDGTAFVPLAGLHEPEFLAGNIGQALGQSFHSDGPPREQLAHFLSGKRLLLLLDNLEHLLSLAAEEVDRLLVDMLHAAPHLTILATSRMRLDVRGETLYPLNGLITELDGEQAGNKNGGENQWGVKRANGDLDPPGALDLFVQSARRMEPAFALTDENINEVASICRGVDGLPLAIVLAASWADLLSPGEIAAKISSSDSRLYQLLESDLHDVPKRHRSLGAVVDSVWSMLSEREREIFARLSIFRGGFDADAAQAVAGATLTALRRLAAKSCIQVTPDGNGGRRYQIHEYLRQFAFAQLQALDEAEAPARDRHASFYMETLHTMEPVLKGPGQRKAVRALTADSENIRAAWQWSARQGRIDLLSNALEPLFRVYDWQGRALDGEAACKQVLDGLPPSDDDPVVKRLQMRLYAWHSLFSHQLSNAVEASTYQQQAIDALNNLAHLGQDVASERATVLLNIGLIAIYNDELTVAEETYRESKAIFQAIGDPWGEAEAIQGLSWNQFNRGKINEALDSQTTVQSIQHRIGDRYGMSWSLLGLGMAYIRIGRFSEALSVLNEAADHCRSLGDRQRMAGVLSEMALLFTLTGEAERGSSHAVEMIVILHDLGMPLWIAVEQCTNGCEPYLHGGRYAEARRLLDEALPMARRQGIQWPMGAGLLRLAKLAMSKGDFGAASAQLAESIPILQSIERLDELGDAHLSLATCEIMAGDLVKARVDLATGLRIGVDADLYATRCHGLAASALLALLDGDVERAVEQYAVAENQPFVGNSSWFEDVYGWRLEEAAAILPANVVAAAEHRGREREFRTTAEAIVGVCLV